MFQVRFGPNQNDELNGGFVDDKTFEVHPSGFASDDGSGGNAEEHDDDGGGSSCGES